MCNWRYGAKSSSTADLEALKYLFPVSAELGTMYNWTLSHFCGSQCSCAGFAGRRGLEPPPSLAYSRKYGIPMVKNTWWGHVTWSVILPLSPTWTQSFHESIFLALVGLKPCIDIAHKPHCSLYHENSCPCRQDRHTHKPSTVTLAAHVCQGLIIENPGELYSSYVLVAAMVFIVWPTTTVRPA